MKPSKTLTLLLLVFSLSTAFSQSQQNETSRNSFYFEGFGNAFIYSINYDRLLVVKEKSALAGRIGLTYYPKKINGSDHGPGVNIEINGLWGTNNHYLEIGGGSTFIYLVQNEESYGSNISLLALTTRVGYRFQKKEGGLLFRIGFTPLFPIIIDKDTSVDRSFIPFGGISIGYTFKKKRTE